MVCRIVTSTIPEQLGDLRASISAGVPCSPDLETISVCNTLVECPSLDTNTYAGDVSSIDAIRKSLSAAAIDEESEDDEDDACSFTTAPSGDPEPVHSENEVPAMKYQVSGQLENFLLQIASRLPTKKSPLPERNTIDKQKDATSPWSAFINKTTSAMDLASVCDPLCRCWCHSPGSSYSWEASGLQRLVGSFRLSFKGRYLERAAHSDPGCVNRKPTQRVQIHYRLPDWVLSTTSFAFSWSNESGTPELLLRIRSKIGPGRNHIMYDTIPRNDVEATKRALVSRKASIHDALEWEWGKSPLHYALMVMKLDVFEFLLMAGGDLYMQDDLGGEPIELAFTIVASRLPGAQRLSELISFDEHLEDAGYGDIHKVLAGLLPLPLDEALQLPRIRAQANMCNNRGNSPLFFAATGGEVRLLCAAGADPNLPNRNGVTPLMMACMRGQYGVVEGLLECGADVNKVNAHGGTPLVYLTHCDMPNVDREYITRILILLLEAGADVDHVVPDGGTSALELGCDDLEFMWILLSAGPDGMFVDGCGHGPLMYAMNKGSSQVMAVKVGILLCYGVRLDLYLKEDGWNILHYAARYASLETLEMLACWAPIGLDARLRSADGKTPMNVLAERVDLCKELVAAMESLIQVIDGGDGEEATKEKILRIRHRLESIPEFRKVREKWPLSIAGVEPGL